MQGKMRATGQVLETSVHTQAGRDCPGASNSWSPGRLAPVMEMEMLISLRLMPLNVQTLWASDGMPVKAASGFMLTSSVHLPSESTYTVSIH